MKLKPIAQSFSVNYTYKLHFTQNLFHIDNGLFKNIIKGYDKKRKVKLFFVVDNGVLEHHPQLLESINAYCVAYGNHLQFTSSLVIAGGEQCKNDPGYVDLVLEGINSNAICRHSFVVVIGGGAVIDMAGYAAAIAHRGVKLIRIPTTVLSQNDSAVGVKNSVNLFEKKNFLGTFAPPSAIINDSEFLKTLEQRDWIAGISEAIKVSLIKDAEFFRFIEQRTERLRKRHMPTMDEIIYKCAEMHMDHISQGGDPFESGSSRPLDFGHWAAHKLEQMTHYNLRHGEAVAKGIALDVTYANLMGLIPEKTLKRIIKVMEDIGFNLLIPIESDNDMIKLLKGIEEFREHLGGALTITLISDIGKKHDVHEIDMEIMKKAVSDLNVMCTINTI
ncbi:MAG: 3-dehydroquinate synthase [Flavobacteriales bacterium]|nr:MAG: 3-dehydroquinate synthase [Flavobacteriales bacterium]